MKKTFKVTIRLVNGDKKTFGAVTTLRKLKRFLKKRVLEVPLDNTLHIVPFENIARITIEELKDSNVENVTKIKYN